MCVSGPRTPLSLVTLVAATDFAAVAAAQPASPNTLHSLPCASTAFVAKTVPLPCASHSAFVAKTVPLPCGSQKQMRETNLALHRSISADMVRHCHCLVFPLPFVAKTPPLPCVSTALPFGSFCRPLGQLTLPLGQTLGEDTSDDTSLGCGIWLGDVPDGHSGRDDPTMGSGLGMDQRYRRRPRRGRRPGPNRRRD